MKKLGTRIAACLVVIASIGAASLSSGMERGSGSEGRADRMDSRDVSDRTDRNASRDAERAAQDADRARIRAQEDAARADADRVRDEIRAEANIAEQLARAREDAAEEAARAARDALRAAEDAAEEAAKAAEDAAKAAEDAAEDAAKAAEDAAEDAARAAAEANDSNGAAALRELVSGEDTELDAAGFPVRRGEIIALDLDDDALTAIQASGFAVIEQVELGSGAGELTRLSTPPSLSIASALDELRRAHPSTVFDFAHFFGGQFASAGRIAAGPAVRPNAPTARATRSRFDVGMVDTGVALPSGSGPTRIVARNFGGASGAGTHGTAVASILARQGAGRILAANVFRGSGAVGHANADGVARALGWLIEERVPVINLSFAGPRNAVVDALLDRATGRGQLVVAAVGNGGPTSPPAYPAASPGVIAVTATDTRDAIYRYAVQGRHVHFAARGVDVPANLPDGSSALFTGTSFAAPFVAAVLSQCIARTGRNAAPQCTAALERQARDLGTPGRDDVYGYGLVG